MSDHSVLAPCPFCGNEAKASNEFCEDMRWCVYCVQCHASSGYYRVVNEAIEQWNKRANAPAGGIALDGEQWTPVQLVEDTAYSDVVTHCIKVIQAATRQWGMPEVQLVQRSPSPALAQPVSAADDEGA